MTLGNGKKGTRVAASTTNQGRPLHQAEEAGLQQQQEQEVELVETSGDRLAAAAGSLAAAGAGGSLAAVAGSLAVEEDLAVEGDIRLAAEGIHPAAAKEVQVDIVVAAEGIHSAAEALQLELVEDSPRGLAEGNHRHTEKEPEEELLRQLAEEVDHRQPSEVRQPLELQVALLHR